MSHYSTETLPCPLLEVPSRRSSNAVSKQSQSTRTQWSIRKSRLHCDRENRSNPQLAYGVCGFWMRASISSFCVSGRDPNHADKMKFPMPNRGRVVVSLGICLSLAQAQERLPNGPGRDTMKKVCSSC